MADVTDLARRVAALGDDITPELIAGSHELYAGMHPPAGGVRTTRDLAYGSHPRQLLDVHVAEDAAGPPRPVLEFVHGGGFVAGQKSEPGSPYWDNIGAWAARAGLVGVTMSYRLAPEHAHPAAAEDVGAAVAWLGEHVAEHGGDPERIVLMGQSAGASHVAGHVALTGGGPGVRGVVLVAGAYDLVAFDRADIVGPYYGEDPAGWARASALPGLVASGLPVLVAVAEHDPDISHRQSALAIEALFARDERLPHIAWLPGHNHITEVLHIGTGDEVLGDHVRRFVAAHA